MRLCLSKCRTIGGFIERRRFRGEFHVDGLSVGLVSPFEVGAVAFGRIAMAGALRPHFIIRFKTVPFTK